jgi:ribose transport system ATP-binding protein
MDATTAHDGPRTGADDLLEARGIRKSFNGVEVLHGVDLALRAGEVHGLVGQNGAGKSTLMKILNGVYKRDAGDLLIRGRSVDYSTPLEARRAGIAMVFQEFSLIPSMTVAENVLLTREPHRRRLVDDRAMNRAVAKVLEQVGVDVSPRARVDTLSVGTRQLVEIAKALSQEPAILVLDEPTASLGVDDSQTLFDVIRRLKDQGIAIVYISHHLGEVIDVCDRVTVLRDGSVTLSVPTSEISMEAMVAAMVGGTLDTELRWQERQVDRSGTPLLRVTGLSSANRTNGISFELHKGEVIGVAGLLGSGRSELLRALFGVDRIVEGTIEVAGNRVRINSPAKALQVGIALVPEDRHRAGLAGAHTVQANTLMAAWRRISRLGFVQDKVGVRMVHGFIERLKIRTRGPSQLVALLSGGNQQKVVVAKNLSVQPRVLLLDDPTVGIDVKSKADILEEIRVLTRGDSAVILVSSELSELSAVADRVAVMQHGRIAAWLDREHGDDLSEESLSLAVQRVGG